MMISKLFDDIKTTSNDKLMKNEENNAVSASTLYFDKNSMEAFNQELYSLMDRYSVKGKETTIEKSFFFALFTEDKN
jgi:hypothetical protein